MHTVSSLMLVIGTMAFALGLGTITASLTHEIGDNRGTGLGRSPQAAESGKELGALPGSLDHVIAITRAVVTTRGTDRERSTLPQVSATGPWTSPLYPQNGVTLWDRIRVSSKRDQRAYLLGTAIQIHAPAVAAVATRSSTTPEPRVPVGPRCCLRER